MQLDGADPVPLDGAGAAPLARRRRFAPLLDRDWLLALALAFAVGVSVWFGRAIKEFFAPSAASVFTPAFTGQTQGDANAECNRLRLRCVVITTQPSEQFPKGVVMSQQPDAGARVREGRQISLIVSSGLTIFPMPTCASNRCATRTSTSTTSSCSSTRRRTSTTTRRRATTSSARIPRRWRACAKVRRSRCRSAKARPAA